MRARTTAVIGTALAMAAIVGSGPVSAQTLTTKDAAGDVVVWSSKTQTSSERSTAVDILSTRVRYDNGSLVVKTRFRDLTKTNTTITAKVTSLHNYWFDTDPERRGYEYNIHDARGENLHRARPGADRRIPCQGLTWKPNLSTNVTTLVVPRSCFAKSQRRAVRVKFSILQTGPGRAPAGGGSYFLDTMEDTIRSATVRYGG